MTGSAATSLESQLAELSARVGALAAEREAMAAERDEYRRLYLQALELCRKLELASSDPNASGSQRATRS